MKGTTVETMKGWSADERTVKLREWTQALFNLRLQKATGQLENPMNCATSRPRPSWPLSRKSVTRS